MCELKEVKYLVMVPANCAVVNCFNNSKKLKYFKETPCEKHAALLKNECGCEPPFPLYMFPSIKRNFEKREAWIKLLKRVTTENKEWKPCSNDRVCREHYVDGIPTVENPNPTQYELKQTKPRRTLFREPKKLPASSASAQSTNHTTVTISGAAFISPPPSSLLACPDFSSPVSEHSYCTRNNPIKCESCDNKDVLINLYKKKLEQLTRENRLLKRAKLLKSKHMSFSWPFIKTDKKMNVYTGLSSIKLFEAVYNLLSLYIPRILYCRGTKTIISSKVRSRIFIQSSQKK